MKCPHCGHPDDHVIDSRPVETGSAIRRRRECLACEKRFTTYERLEVIPLTVLKSDNRREPFDRAKLREGIALACRHRNVTADQIEKVVTEVELALQEEFIMEVPSRTIGDRVLAKLKALDDVAYVRFASVYKQFSDIDSFLTELRDLKEERKHKTKKSKLPPLNGTVKGWDSRILNTN